MVWTTAALAYETDQLVFRDRQLADGTAYADALMDELLTSAVAAVNAERGCEGTDDELRHALAERLHDDTSRRRPAWERGPLRAPGFSRFTAALESSAAIDKFPFAEREDIYGGVGAGRSLILRLAGPCSTFEIGGVRTGSDKFDHFLDTGYHYFLADERRPGTAIARGTASERRFYGWLTSKTFSYADLAANADGWRFYRELLGPGSPVRREPSGCLAVEGAWDWRAWVDPSWDEVLNPPAYTRRVEETVLATLEARRGEICTARDRWDPERARDADIDVPRAYVAGPAPAPRDPWQLAALCDPGRREPLTPIAASWRPPPRPRPDPARSEPVSGASGVR